MKLDVRPTPRGKGPLGMRALLLHNRETGEPLPNQVEGKTHYGVDRDSWIEVRFRIDGRDVAMGDNTRHLADECAAAAYEARQANDLAAASAAFASLSRENRERFFAMYPDVTHQAEVTALRYLCETVAIVPASGAGGRGKAIDQLVELARQVRKLNPHAGRRSNARFTAPASLRETLDAIGERINAALLSGFKKAMQS